MFWRNVCITRKCLWKPMSLCIFENWMTWCENLKPVSWICHLEKFFHFFSWCNVFCFIIWYYVMNQVCNWYWMSLQLVLNEWCWLRDAPVYECIEYKGVLTYSSTRRFDPTWMFISFVAFFINLSLSIPKLKLMYRFRQVTSSIKSTKRSINTSHKEKISFLVSSKSFVLLFWI